MNTLFLLMAEFETAHIPLRDICEKYFSLDFRQACRRAAVQQLPVPVFRCSSQKSQWLVDIKDLASYLDTIAQKAREDHRKMRTTLA